MCKSIQAFARRNSQSTGELFAEYVRYMAWECDYAKHVISVRHGMPMLKTDKAEADCWPMHNRLSVEDPFETWYDVAHVLKNTQMDYLRKEFVVCDCASLYVFSSHVACVYYSLQCHLQAG